MRVEMKSSDTAKVTPESDLTRATVAKKPLGGVDRIGWGGSVDAPR